MQLIDKLILGLIPAYIVYIFVLGFYMFKIRVKALKNKTITVAYLKTYEEKSPEYLKVLQNHYSSQFEIPIIFFLTCLAVVFFGKSSFPMFFLALSFILSRLFHSFIHLGSNNLKLRATSYISGFLIILLIWILFYLS